MPLMLVHADHCRDVSGKMDPLSREDNGKCLLLDAVSCMTDWCSLFCNPLIITRLNQQLIAAHL